MERFDAITVAKVDDDIRAEGPEHYRPNAEELSAWRVRRLYYELTRQAVHGTRDPETSALLIALSRKWEALAIELLRVPTSATAYARWREGLLTNAEFESARRDTPQREQAELL